MEKKKIFFLTLIIILILVAISLKFTRALNPKESEIPSCQEINGNLCASGEICAGRLFYSRNGETCCQDECVSSNCKETDSTCDGVDDDCDGFIDDDYVPQETECGSGICSSRGELRCLAGGIRFDTCEPLPPREEICGNKIDDNCNSIIDDSCNDLCTKGLVGFWNLEKNVNDLGNNFNGVLQGNPNWIDSRFGSALEFDGKTQIDFENELNVPGDFTISWWTKGGEGVILGRPTEETCNSQQVLFSDGVLKLLAFESGCSTFEVISNESIDKEWENWIMNRTGGGMKIYLNGKDVTQTFGPGTDNISAGYWTSVFNPQSIGKADTKFFTGTLDEIGIWNRTLTQEEIKQLAEGETCR